MIPTHSILRGTLRWSQPKATSLDFELHADAAPVGGLHIRGIAHTLATAECGNDQWTFRREGFWRKRATVLRESGPKEVASFEYNTWNPGGTLRFLNGRTFTASANFWQTLFTLRESGGTSIVTFRTEGILRLSGTVEAHTSMYERSEFPLILCFGWYLIVMMHHEKE